MTMSYGAFEQGILEAIEDGLPGFRGGWLASCAVDDLVERKGLPKLGPWPKKQAYENLGFIEVAVRSARVINQLGNRRPKLYRRKDYPSITTEMITQQFIIDQGWF